jgi:hypothetical protein
MAIAKKNEDGLFDRLRFSENRLLDFRDDALRAFRYV